MTRTIGAGLMLHRPDHARLREIPIDRHPGPAYHNHFHRGVKRVLQWDQAKHVLEKMMPRRYCVVLTILLIALNVSISPPAVAQSPLTGSATVTATGTPTATDSMTPSSTPTPASTTTPMTRLQLPSVARFYPATRFRSGLHLGNRLLDWNTPIDFLQRVDLASDVTTPRVVVALSSQIFTVQRAATAPCAITGVAIGNAYLFDFLDRAVRDGAWIVIRIYPSPGNFSDYADPGPAHTLLSGATPAGPDYCSGRSAQFRATSDVAAEMAAITAFVFDARGWPAGGVFFEPANEPNLEWYEGLRKTHPDLAPAVEDSRAWKAMDAYFAAVYDRAHALEPRVRVLAPPMAQHLFADTREFGTCTRTILIVNGVPQYSAGYDWMQTTYTTKNDGWSWHNYWRAGYEAWRDDFCQMSDAVGDHVFQYFPAWLQNVITTSAKPAFITEADLLSPCVFPLNALVDKEDADATAGSLTQFMAGERAADAIAVWVLTNQFADPTPATLNCDDANAEMAWHEAYRDTPVGDGYERAWFPLWWGSTP